MTTATVQADQADTATGPQLVDVALAKLVAHPRNPRRDVGDVTDLAASITAVGILEPLIVAPNGRGKLILIAGHRRLAAARKAKLKWVPCLIRPDLDTDAKQLEAMLVENLHRADLSPVEEADAYQAMLDLPGKLTQAQLATQVGQPVSRVRERLKVAKLDPAVKDKLHAHQLTIGDALAIGEFADDPDTTKDLLKFTNGSARDFEWRLRGAQNKRRTLLRTNERLGQFQARGIQHYQADGAPPGSITVTSHDSPFAIPVSFRYPQSTSEENRLDEWVLANHGDCPGIATSAGPAGQLLHLCIEPKRHPRSKQPAKSKAELKHEQEVKEKKRALREQMDVATPLRRRHVSILAGFTRLDLLTRSPLPNVPDVNDAPALAAARTRAARTRLEELILDTVRDWEHARDLTPLAQVLADVLRVPPPEKETGQRKLTIAPVIDMVEAALAAARDLAGLVLLLDVVTNASREATLDDSATLYPFRGGRTYTPQHVEWLRALESAYGYQVSEFEQNHFLAVPDEQEDDDPEDAEVDDHLDDDEPVDGDL